MPYLQLGDIWGLWAKTSDLAVHHDPRRRSYAAAVVDYSTIQATPVPNLLHDPRAGHHPLHPHCNEKGRTRSVAKPSRIIGRWIYCRRRRRDTTHIAVRDHSESERSELSSCCRRSRELDRTNTNLALLPPVNAKTQNFAKKSF